jgi:hypothetical protein
MQIRDQQGNILTWQELHAQMGNVEIHPRPRPDAPGWAVRMLLIHDDSPANLTVGLWEGPQPAIGRKVAWYWPDAPLDPNAGWLARADSANTNSGNSGAVDLCMGGGATYWPPAGGPHCVWVYGSNENSEMVSGLGMVGGFNHKHLDIFFEWVDPTHQDEIANLLREIVTHQVTIDRNVSQVNQYVRARWPMPSTGKNP